MKYFWKYTLIFFLSLLLFLPKSSLGQELVLQNKIDGKFMLVPLGSQLNIKIKDGEKIKGELIGISSDSLLVENHLAINIGSVKNLAIVLPYDSVAIAKIKRERKYLNTVATSFMIVGSGLWLVTTSIVWQNWPVQVLLLIASPIIYSTGGGVLAQSFFLKSFELNKYDRGFDFKSYDWNYQIYEKPNQIDSTLFVNDYNHVARQKQFLVGIGLTDIFDPAYGLDLVFGIHLYKKWRAEAMFFAHSNFSKEFPRKHLEIAASLNRIYKFRDTSFAYLGLGIGRKSFVETEQSGSVTSVSITCSLQAGFQFRDYSRLSLRFLLLSYFPEVPYASVSFMVPLNKR